jgi:predicted ArsR family transcriptional regulator
MRLETAKTEGEVAAELQISKSQARVWLQRLVKQGALEKISKPTRYRAVSDRERLL